MKYRSMVALGLALLLAGCGSLEIHMEYEGISPSDTPGARADSGGSPGPLSDGAMMPSVHPSVLIMPTSPAPEDGMVIAVSAGHDHTCAVTKSGRVMCWGSNDHGQLGNGNWSNSNVPVEVAGLTDAKAVAAGWKHTCALTAGGGVKCWGYNLNGELGGGETADSGTPMDVRGLASGVRSIAAGDDHTCAVTEQGGVTCWGYNEFGQLGDATTTSRSIPIDAKGISGGVLAVAAGWGHTCALTDDGSVVCWGNNEHGQLGYGQEADYRFAPVDVAPLARSAVTIRAGGAQSCALTIYGGIQCWGNNPYGQLGDGTADSRNSPVAVKGLTPDQRDVAAGWNHSCAVTGLGAVKCWGWNFYGQLGDGTKASRPQPDDVYGLSSGVEAVGLGWAHSCAVTDLGAVKCWGSNAFGQLGDGSNIDSQVPVAAAGLGGGPQPTPTGPTSTATVTPTVTDTQPNTPTPTATRSSTNTFTPTETVSPQTFSSVSSGLDFNCVLIESARVFCWGSGVRGQLGNGSKSDSPVPVEVKELGYDQIYRVEAGQSHACVLTIRGKMMCWGANDHGQLGDGTTIDSTIPVAVSVVDESVVEMALGADFTCVRIRDAVKCWGGNAYGQLGNGKTADSLTPVDVKDLSINVNLLSAGKYSACANTFPRGAVYCWGENSSGQLGDGTAADRTSPVAVAGLNINYGLMSVGINHTCLRTGVGEVQCWGANDRGQLGDGTAINRYTAVYVRKLVRIVAAQAGDGISCALTDTAEVKCWGDAGSGVTGRAKCGGSGLYCSEPVLVTGFSGRVVGLSVGNTHACAVMETGGIVCWGSNTHGQLGDRTTENRSTPVEVSGFEGAAEPTGLPPLGPKLPTDTPTKRQ